MLKFIIFSFLIHQLIQSSLYFVSSNSSSNYIQSKAVENLIRRLIGEQKSALFQVVVKDNGSSTDWFSVEKMNNSIHIVGNNGVAAAYGFHFYLKHYCNCHISWDNDQLELPENLPDTNISISSIDRYRYYQNVCVYSYSYVWWKWTRWEREIDWMALNGFNLALAFTGQESVWLRIYKRLNMTDNEINEHFAGPAFLAWGRMANIRGWGGPLTQNWHDEAVELQHKILQRMNELGIMPVLPAFCGHVPRAFKRLFPRVKMTRLPVWVNFTYNFCCPYLLDPSEPLFQTIGEMFMLEMKNEFGLTHFYNCDTFNENQPHTTDVRYLERISSVIFRTMNESDPKATWIMQGWLFADDQSFWTEERVRHFLLPVPNHKMIVLDLHSELRPQYIRLKSYFGKPFIWCMLHNFGGTLGMHGSFDILNAEILQARNMINSTLIGTGVTPEGINQNYVIYDFMSEASWRNDLVNLNAWVEQYAERRYGKRNINAIKSWILLKHSVYNYSLPEPLHGQYTLCIRPNLKLKPRSWYNHSSIYQAWDLMVNISDEGILKNLNFKHDLVDLTRQVFQLLFDELFEKVVKNYLKQDARTFLIISDTLSNLLTDMDILLSTNERFMLGYWIRKAKLMGNSRSERKNLIMNAKNQITLWGPNGEVLDYATKQWSGVVRDYYHPRWSLFFQYLYASMTSKMPFHQNIFNEAVFTFIEKPFTYNSITYPSIPQNDPLKTTKFLYNKWRRMARGLEIFSRKL